MHGPSSGSTPGIRNPRDPPVFRGMSELRCGSKSARALPLPPTGSRLHRVRPPAQRRLRNCAQRRPGCSGARVLTILSFDRCKGGASVPSRLPGFASATAPFPSLCDLVFLFPRVVATKTLLHVPYRTPMHVHPREGVLSGSKAAVVCVNAGKKLFSSKPQHSR